MTLKEAQKKIRDNEMPASEAARLLDQVSNAGCIHFTDGSCSKIDFCTNDAVEDNVRYNEIINGSF